ncbi:TetR/AcrR family transcriptional regulator; helix-turn-helix transcriptional regulator [Roseomonas sp. OT10]|uniref:TetR/AcrR family transcriptional regulator n=1 Tax=Roseomonas cutis TaxID=2897332 RepID=UPI001E42E664|nr:TetR/AcrR family transcriptional regulator [Roseomonas sp. OT10]UFN49013.1 TetR/AcrR family transcriptional regulator; helix-turn-helix transcriptional regulator [Roseomonas sp. OT10]
MRAERQEERRREIEAAAYAVLSERGYAGTSMLAIARRAGASNGTLYAWYGSKQGLFAALVAANAGTVAELLRAGLDPGHDPLEALGLAGPALLRLLLGERAMALNRAAAADADAAGSGVLGRTLAEAGRGTVMPLIAGVIGRAQAAGQMGGEDAAAAAELYLSLLLGDWQLRRVIGALPLPGEAELTGRAALALRRTCLLLAWEAEAPPPQ